MNKRFCDGFDPEKHIQDVVTQRNSYVVPPAMLRPAQTGYVQRKLERYDKIIDIDNNAAVGSKRTLETMGLDSNKRIKLDDNHSRDIYNIITQTGISMELAEKIYARNNRDALNTIKEIQNNKYCLQKDIDLIMSQAGVSMDVAIHAYYLHDSDIVNSIMFLTA
jgi:NACalpha-BTF3-like transcription factor